MDAVLVQASRLAALDRLAAVGGPLAATELRLGVNNISVGPGTVLADLQEATFAGYAPVAAIAFGSAYIDPNGVVRIDAPSETFEMTATTTLEVVYYWYLVNTAGTALVAIALLDNPVPLTEVSQGLSVLPSVPASALA